MYEAIVAPGLAELRKELKKVPAFERMLTQHQEGQAGQAWGPASAIMHPAHPSTASPCVAHFRALSGSCERYNSVQ